MGFDLYPMDTLAAKKAFARDALERETLVFFPHDPAIAAGLPRRAERQAHAATDVIMTTIRACDWHHRRQRPVRHGRADRPRRARRSRHAVRRSVRPVRRSARCAASASRFWRGTASGHRILPSELNFRANIYGFKVLGVERILSASAVGSLKEEYRPLDILVPDQFFDRTRGRISTFFGRGHRRAHRLCASALRGSLDGRRRFARQTVGATVHRGGTYVNMEGPQFSTLAESRLYRSWGMDVIGMTNLQEAKLAREAEICYATLALVTDYDCWHPDHDSVTVDLIIANLMQNAATAQKTIAEAVSRLERPRTCACKDALATAIITQARAHPGADRSRSSRRSSGST